MNNTPDYDDNLAFKPELTWEELCKYVENTAAVSNDSFYKDGLTFYKYGTVFAGDNLVTSFKTPSQMKTIIEALWG